MEDRIYCRECGKRIEHKLGRWVHIWSGSIWCGQDGYLKAEP